MDVHVLSCDATKTHGISGGRDRTAAGVEIATGIMAKKCADEDQTEEMKKNMKMWVSHEWLIK